MAVSYPWRVQQESSRDGAEPNIQHCPTLNESLDRVVQLKAWSQRSTSMLVSSPIPSAQYASLLTVDRVRAVLDACGYRSAAVLLAGTHSLSPGCTVALQFGDQIAMSGGGATRLTIRCSLQINGVDDRIDGATYWQIRKLFRLAIGTDGLSVAVEADMILGSGKRLADIPVDGGDAYRHLRRLIADARATLHDLSIDDRPGWEPAGPVLRIDAKFLGDLAAGRSGLVASTDPGISSHRASTTTRHLSMMQAACDCLNDDVLPDLSRAVRSMILQAGRFHSVRASGLFST
jgi:hypothetical protein